MEPRIQYVKTRDGALRDLPSGTVTFLFTDIQGCTKLLRELGRRLFGCARPLDRLEY